MNLNFFHFRRRTQSEMQPRIRTRPVASPADHVGALPNASGSHKNLRADGIPRTFWSANQFKCDPMVPVRYNVSEERRRRVHVVQDNVNVAVVEEIAKRRTARGNDIRQAAPCCGRNFLKLSAIEIAEQLRSLRPGCAPVALVHRGVNVAIGQENVQESIIIEV